MIDPLLIAAWGFTLILLPWFAMIAMVVAAAITGRCQGNPINRPPGTPAAGSTRFLILIPAHDEELVIGVTVASCLSVDYDADQFQVCVIADNCTDATAAAAAAAGALVWSRTDLARKSKGYALEDFFDRGQATVSIRLPDAYVFVDADTSVAPNLLREFDRAIARGDDFVQGYYTVRNADASWRTRLMTYAFSLTNGVWLAGLDRLGLSVGLKGNGMCFRAEGLQRFPWKAAGLVEDMEFAWNLRVGGERVRFLPSARVYGEMVSRGGAGATSQRRRWEMGRRELRRTFRGAIARSARSSWIAKILYRIDLEFPPLGRLVISLGGLTLLVTTGIILDRPKAGWTVLFGVVTIKWVCLVTYLISPIFVLGLPVRYLADLAYAPIYLAWKLTLGLGKPPAGWVRTPREAPENGTRSNHR